MAKGIFTLKQVNQAIRQNAWPNSAPKFVEYLVVAGGGSGGGQRGLGGGGGAGGLLTGIVPVTAGASYTVTVGGGGVDSASANGGVGTNSVFGTISVSGGGTGGEAGQNGYSGGSGGGGGNSATSGRGGSGVSGQGNSGGTGYSGGSPYGAGGGGGVLPRIVSLSHTPRWTGRCRVPSEVSPSTAPIARRPPRRSSGLNETRWNPPVFGSGSP